jgi:hypothetical protein
MLKRGIDCTCEGMMERYDCYKRDRGKKRMTVKSIKLTKFHVYNSARITHYASPITHYALRITHHALRITDHALRIIHVWEDRSKRNEQIIFSLIPIRGRTNWNILI